MCKHGNLLEDMSFFKHIGRVQLSHSFTAVQVFITTHQSIGKTCKLAKLLKSKINSKRNFLYQMSKIKS